MAEPATPPAPPAQPANDGAVREKLNDPARTGFDPETKWWTNYFKMISGQMTNEGKFHFREATYEAQEEKDCKRCEDFRDWLFAYSPQVRFLGDKIKQLNGDLNPSNVLCRRCPRTLTEDGTVRGQSGGFDPNIGILLCANEIKNRKHLEDTLSHEMVHAYDHLRWKVDWAGEQDLKQSACTEIRASMLSGECRWAREFWERNNWGLTQQFQQCVRKRATLSLMARKSCQGEEHASKIINQVWDSCFADTRPFDEVYR